MTQSLSKRNAWRELCPSQSCPRSFKCPSTIKISGRFHTSTGLQAISLNSQQLVWPAISVLLLRLSSAMWYTAGSGGDEGSDWLVWAILSRDWTMAWRRQVIHCCLLKESLACRLYGGSFERPLLLTRKQFLTGRRRETERRMEDRHVRVCFSYLVIIDKYGSSSLQQRTWYKKYEWTLS